MGYELEKLKRQYGVASMAMPAPYTVPAPVRPEDSAMLPAYETDLARYEADRAAADQYRSEFLNRLQNTPMYLASQFQTRPQTPPPTTVQGLYETYLGRSPDTQGASDWKNRFTDPQVLAAQRPPQLDLSKYGLGDVSSLYSTLLGRDADPEGLRHYQEAFGPTIELDEIDRFLAGAQGSDLPTAQTALDYLRRTNDEAGARMILETAAGTRPLTRDVLALYRPEAESRISGAITSLDEMLTQQRNALPEPVIGQRERELFLQAARPEMAARGIPAFGQDIYAGTGSYWGDQLQAPKFQYSPPIAPLTAINTEGGSTNNPGGSTVTNTAGSTINDFSNSYSGDGGDSSAGPSGPGISASDLGNAVASGLSAMGMSGLGSIGLGSQGVAPVSGISEAPTPGVGMGDAGGVSGVGDGSAGNDSDGGVGSATGAGPSDGGASVGESSGAAADGSDSDGSGGGGGGGGGGGCFITSAVLKNTDEKDDGKTLSLLRKFRDAEMLGRSGKKKEISWYYKNAPKIVKAIDRKPNSDKIYQNLYDRFIKPAANAVEKGDNKTAYEIYRKGISYAVNASGISAPANMAAGGKVKFFNGGLNDLSDKYALLPNPTGLPTIGAVPPGTGGPPAPAAPMAAPPATARPPAAGPAGLEGLLGRYLEGANPYATELASARRAASAESDTFNRMLQDAMKSEEDSGLSKAEMYFRLAAAFGAPTKTGSMAEQLSLVGKELSDVAKSKRESAKTERARRTALALEGQKLKMATAKEDLGTLRTLAGEEMKDRREILKEYMKTGMPQSEAGKVAKDSGLTPGTEEYNKFVKDYVERKFESGDLYKQAMLALSQGTFELRRSAEQRATAEAARLTPAELKLKSDTEDKLSSIDGALENLREAYRLNPNTFGGTLAERAQFTALEQTGSRDPRVLNTRNVENLLGQQALAKLKTTFGGNPTEGERAILLELEGIGAKTREQRGEIMKRAYKAMKSRRDREQKRLNEINQGLYRSTRSTADEVDTEEID